MAGNIFLKIEGVTGECVEDAHKGWIDVESYAQGLSSMGSSSYGGGGGVGTVTYQDLSVTCKLEKAIPNLMKACADHKPYPKVTLDELKMGGNAWVYFQITLTDAIVTSVNFGGSGNQEPTVQLSFNFSKIKTEYWEQNKEGGKGSSTNAGWDQKANKSF